MDGVKIIDLSSSTGKPKRKLTKKQMYKEILSSSDTVKEIISKRKKTCRFDYLNTIPTITASDIKNNKSITKSETKVNTKQPETEPKSNLIAKQPETVPKSNLIAKQPETEPKSRKKQNTIKNYFKTEHTPAESQTMIKPELQEPEISIKQPEQKKRKQRQKKSVSFKDQNSHQPKNDISKILNQKSSLIQKSLSKPEPTQKPILKAGRRISQPKRFSETQIVDILGILVKLNKLGQLNKIHKTIRRINILQTNQLLFALRLIKNYSNAPERMLKTTLFNYITGDIFIVRG